MTFKSKSSGKCLNVTGQVILSKRSDNHWVAAWFLFIFQQNPDYVDERVELFVSCVVVTSRHKVNVCVRHVLREFAWPVSVLISSSAEFSSLIVSFFNDAQLLYHVLKVKVIEANMYSLILSCSGWRYTCLLIPHNAPFLVSVYFGSCDAFFSSIHHHNNVEIIIFNHLFFRISFSLLFCGSLT